MCNLKYMPHLCICIKWHMMVMEKHEAVLGHSQKAAVKGLVQKVVMAVVLVLVVVIVAAAKLGHCYFVSLYYLAVKVCVSIMM